MVKTSAVAIVLCLNFGVDPPDIIKPIPCARKEAWVDPSLMNMKRVSQRVAFNLQKSFELVDPEARFKFLVFEKFILFPNIIDIRQ